MLIIPFLKIKSSTLRFIRLLFIIMSIFLLICEIPILANPDVVTLNNPRVSNEQKPLFKANASFFGEDIEDRSGWSISKAYDVNGDGYDDFLIGAPGNNEEKTNSGKIYLIFGKKSGWFLQTNLDYADVSFNGVNENDNLGWSIAGIGDMNKDGYDDIIIGAPGNDAAGIDAGITYIIFGNNYDRQQSSLYQANYISFLGISSYEYSGHAVAGGGDINGDGYDDFLIGAPGKSNTQTSSGKVYLLFGGNNEWSENYSLSDEDAQFVGEKLNDHSGYSVAIAGDVNGDGFDDILIGAPNSSSFTGKTYLVFGKSDWGSTEYYLSDSDVIFYGENFLDCSGIAISGAGDVNNDGFDDILIGAKNNDEGGEDAGKTYLIFGKCTGWPATSSLSNVDISFIGEGAHNLSGASVASAGDVNGDGNEDILIGAPGNFGTTYLIWGRNSGWQKNNNLKNANVSFKGEAKSDNAGAAVSGVRDVNGDGCDDILIGAWGNVGLKGQNSGQTYLVFHNNNFKPSSTEYVKLYEDEDYSHRATSVNFGYPCYIELKGIDGNLNGQDIAEVKVCSNKTDPYGIKVRLFETEENSGIYRGKIQIENVTHESHGWIASSSHEKIIVKSLANPLIFSSVLVNSPPIILQKPNDMVEIFEDQFYQQIFDYFDLDNDKITWSFDTNATWLNFGTLNNTVYGTPTNDDIGIYGIRIYIEDVYGEYDEFNYTLIVKNLNDPPKILKVANSSSINDTIKLYATEDEWINFTVVAEDIDINDELDLLIDNKHFKISQYSDNQFNLSFFPTNRDVGIVILNIQVWDNFKPPLNDTVRVIIFINNTNDPPKYIEILEPFPIMTYKSVDIINFSGYCYDPDLEVPNTTEALNFSWHSDLIGEFGNTKVFNTSLMAGVHNITFKVQDRLGSSNQVNISLRVNPTNLPLPSLNLSSPIDEKIISNTSIELEWSPAPYGFGELSYDIYFDTISPPIQRLARNYNSTKYSINNLSDGANYYWTIIPKYRGHCGNCKSGVWGFSIDTTFNQIYDLQILSELIDTNITLTPGEERTIDIWVFNTGNGIDLIELKFYSNELRDYIIINPTTFNLDTKNQMIIQFEIKIPNDCHTANYIVKFTAISIDSMRYNNINISDEMNFTITVQKIVEDEPPGINFLYIFVILFPIFVIVTTIAIVLLIRKFKGKIDNTNRK